MVQIAGRKDFLSQPTARCGEQRRPQFYYTRADLQSTKARRQTQRL
jgi:hypothetical protein